MERKNMQNIPLCVREEETNKLRFRAFLSHWSFAVVTFGASELTGSWLWCSASEPDHWRIETLNFEIIYKLELYLISKLPLTDRFS